MKRSAFALAALLPCLAASLGTLDREKTIGNPAAPVRIDLFSDFQCPACKGFHEAVLPELMRNYIVPGKAYMVCHEFPLAMHPYSHDAANLATAAASVGKYQVVADALFQNQATWGASGKVWDTVAPVLTPAEQKKVQALAKDPNTVGEVQQEVNLGTKEKVTQTPTLVVSRGVKHYSFPGPNPSNYPILKALIDETLK